MNVPFTPILAILLMIGHLLVGCCDHHAHAAADDGDEAGLPVRELPTGRHDVAGPSVVIADPCPVCGSLHSERPQPCTEGTCVFSKGPEVKEPDPSGASFPFTVASLLPRTSSITALRGVSGPPQVALAGWPLSVRPQRWLSCWLL